MFLLLALLQQNPTKDRHFPELEHPGAEAQLRQVVDRICGDPGKLDRVGLLKREDEVSYDAHDSHALRLRPGPRLAAYAARSMGDGAISREVVSKWSPAIRGTSVASMRCSEALAR